jgi:hypothetical protein
MSRYFLVLLTVLFLACGTRTETFNTKVSFSELPDYTLTPSTYCQDRFEHFNASVIAHELNDTIQFCECQKLYDKLTITIHNCGGMYYEELIIETADSSFVTTFNYTGDVISLDFHATAIEQKLILNKFNPNIGEKLTGTIDFTGLVINGYLREPVHNLSISGTFNCIVSEQKN